LQEVNNFRSAIPALVQYGFQLSQHCRLPKCIGASPKRVNLADVCYRGDVAFNSRAKQVHS